MTSRVIAARALVAAGAYPDIPAAVAALCDAKRRQTEARKHLQRIKETR